MFAIHLDGAGAHAYSLRIPRRHALRILIPREPEWFPSGEPHPMPSNGSDPRSRNRRPRRRMPAGRAPVTEYDEMQEIEAARERNDLDISDLRAMSVNELRSVG